MSRKQYFNQLYLKTAQENGLVIPDPLPRFIGTEEIYDGEIVWAYFSDDLADIAKSFEDSETDCVERFRVYDLDSGEIYVAQFQVLRWIPVDQLPDSE